LGSDKIKGILAFLVLWTKSRFYHPDIIYHHLCYSAGTRQGATQLFSGLHCNSNLFLRLWDDAGNAKKAGARCSTEDLSGF